MATFTDFNLDEGILEGIEMIGFTEPTPIQQEVIPLILEGKDLIACAQTGTGKTAAFLLPLVHMIQQRGESNNVDTIIISPTRELAQQIDQQLQGLSYFAPVSSIAIYGGTGSNDWDLERKALAQGADIIIATPGRLKSHLVHDYARVQHLKHLVLDEADRMLDMGFIEDIRMITSKLPKVRQTLLFSATMPSDIRTLAKEILNNPAEINLALSKPVEGVLQGAYILYEEQKVPLVVSLLKNRDLPRILVFAATKVNVKKLAAELKKQGLNAEEIHSDLPQAKREDVLNKFKAAQVQMLVATDVLSRGIDVQNIDLVINFDVPQDAEDYVHRIGRTARAKSSGVALTLVSKTDQYRFSKIEKLIDTSVFKCKMPEEVGDGPEYKPSAQPRKNFVRKGNGKGNGKGRSKR